MNKSILALAIASVMVCAAFVPISQALSTDPAPAVGDARGVNFDPNGEYWISD